MNKQILMWCLFILPWFTLLFLKKEEARRFVPTALFTAVTSGIILLTGYSAGLWYFKEVNFSLVMYGLLPISALWVIKFTFGRFWIYTIANAILDIGFAFIIIPWFGRIDIFGVSHWSSVYVYVINFFHGLSIYAFQKWQEGSI